MWLQCGQQDLRHEFHTYGIREISTHKGNWAITNAEIGTVVGSQRLREKVTPPY